MNASSSRVAAIVPRPSSGERVVWVELEGQTIGARTADFPDGILDVLERIPNVQRSRVRFRCECRACGRVSVKRIEDMRRARACGRACPRHRLNQSGYPRPRGTRAAGSSQHGGEKK